MHAMRIGWLQWLAVMLVIVLGLPAPASVQAQGTVLEEILEILRKNGQISETQKKALLERAEREAAQRAQGPPPGARPAPRGAEPALAADLRSEGRAAGGGRREAQAFPRFA
jgi:hypothetical protein